jgi:CheY-like chemotaxis protein
VAVPARNEKPRVQLERGGQRGAVILFVEDEALIRLTVSGAVRAAGFTVIEAASGLEADRLLSTSLEIDVLLTDVEIAPGPDGLELAARLRSMKPDVLIVVATSHELSGEALNGANRCVRKPYDERVLANQQAAAVRAELWRHLRISPRCLAHRKSLSLKLSCCSLKTRSCCG